MAPKMEKLAVRVKRERDGSKPPWIIENFPYTSEDNVLPIAETNIAVEEEVVEEIVQRPRKRRRRGTKKDFVRGMTKERFEAAKELHRRELTWVQYKTLPFEKRNGIARLIQKRPETLFSDFWTVERLKAARQLAVELFKNNDTYPVLCFVDGKWTKFRRRLFRGRVQSLARIHSNWEKLLPGLTGEYTILV